tara:strand:+ start:2192 stop:2467 length:276 start_codon:yes stop_codon:yes gene_type:complete
VNNPFAPKVKEKVSVVSVVSIKKATQSALGIFRTALQSLKDINEETEVLQENNNLKMAVLIEENTELSENHRDNSHAIKQIESILSPPSED